MFKNREEAALILANNLSDYSNEKDVVVVAIPRGGVPLGKIIAEQLHVPLELVLSKKIGHPLHKEFAIGAITLHSNQLDIHGGVYWRQVSCHIIQREIQTHHLIAIDLKPIPTIHTFTTVLLPVLRGLSTAATGASRGSGGGCSSRRC